MPEMPGSVINGQSADPKSCLLINVINAVTLHYYYYYYITLKITKVINSNVYTKISKLSKLNCKQVS